ncbi:MAG: hypothetical protein U5J82_09780 [Desulfobacterales bacterium]|nr:hypothetical protein [Desulfobacterales bacterium]
MKTESSSRLKSAWTSHPVSSPQPVIGATWNPIQGPPIYHSPDATMGQTRAIMSMTAKVTKEGLLRWPRQRTIKAWKHFHAQLKPVEVVIPYATQISDSLQRGEEFPIATRRAFNRVMTIIQTSYLRLSHSNSPAMKKDV